MQFASYFREAADEMATAINETMGELVWVTPTVAKPNFPSTTDPARAAFSIAMVFANKAAMGFTKKGYPASGNRDFDLAPLISTRHPIFSVATRELPFSLRQQDRLQRLWDRTEWEITNIKPDGISRIEIEVVQLGRASQLDRAVP